MPQKTTRTLLICLLFCFQALFGLMVLPSASAVQNFPNSFDEAQYLKYEYKQTFEYYQNPVPDEAGGTIEIYITNTTEGYRVNQYYDILIYPVDCNDAYHFSGNINYTITKSTRFIWNTETNIGAMDPATLHSNLYLGNAFEEGYSSAFWMEDLMILRGILINNPFTEQEDTQILIADQLVTCTHALNTTTLIYPELCGLGSGVYIEASINHYYEKNSGLLLRTHGVYLEYLYTNEEVYQKSTISRTLVDLDYPGKPADRNPLFPPIDFEDIEIDYALVGVIAIPIVTVFILRRIRNNALRQQALQYLQEKARETPDEENEPENES